MSNSSSPNDSPGFIPPHGGYDKLQSYQMSVLVYDATVKFCDRFIDPKSRTHDQMVQAARSGNKNISEGSQVSGTSKKIELKLVGVARASLEELLGDYKDFLRQRGLAEWGKDHPMSRLVRRLAYAPNRTYRTYATHIENAPPEVAANTMLCLVHQTNYLLDQQLRQLEQEFLEHGGFTERLYQARQQARTVPPRPSFRRNRTNHTDEPGAPQNPSYKSYVPPPTKDGASPKPRTRP
ncbi:MAG: four helix bundle suffix domain-containing protein [Verrucomicrobiota bacterium]|jgi:four helix bundle suffix protein